MPQCGKSTRKIGDALLRAANRRRNYGVTAQNTTLPIDANLGASALLLAAIALLDAVLAATATCTISASWKLARWICALRRRMLDVHAPSMAARRTRQLVECAVRTTTVGVASCLWINRCGGSMKLGPSALLRAAGESLIRTGYAMPTTGKCWMAFHSSRCASEGITSRIMDMCAFKVAGSAAWSIA